MRSADPKREGRNEVVGVDAVSSEEIAAEHAEEAVHVQTA